MLSLDTNILLPAVETRNPAHARAAAFVDSLQARDDVAICELILFATVNAKDFRDFGFTRVWNPLASP